MALKITIIWSFQDNVFNETKVVYIVHNGDDWTVKTIEFHKVKAIPLQNLI